MRHSSIFFLILIVQCNAQEHHWTFSDHVALGQLLPAEQYKQAVCSLPIVCIDVFLYDRETASYLLVYRKTPPAQGMFWFPGGRLYKGESFFTAARRKCQEEVGLQVEPQAVLGVYSTVFPDSAWGCQTHTINIAILACAQRSELQLDEHHAAYQWVPLSVVPDNLYLAQVYRDAHNNFTVRS